MIAYDPTTRLFTVKNHKEYVVVLPMLATFALTPLLTIVEAVLKIDTTVESI